MKPLNYPTNIGVVPVGVNRIGMVLTLAKISGHKDLRILQNAYYRETADQIAARL